MTAGREHQTPSVLVVVAHPDDEVLGCGGTVSAWSREGIPVHAVFLAGSAEARTSHPGPSSLREDAKEAQRRLGIKEPIFGSFPNISFNTVPHLELVQFIEAAITETQADTLLTHHPADLNDDHVHTARACQAAARLNQRGGRVPPLRALYFMEVLSSTDWSFAPPAHRFAPTAYRAIGRDGVEQKLKALAAYRGVMREYPHPRSPEAISALATVRGAESGTSFAEAFQVAYSIIEPVSGS